MENTLKLVQLRCPNCHSTLSRADKFETKINCPYCGSTIEVAGVAQQAQDLSAPGRIIPFAATEKDFERAIADYFLGLGDQKNVDEELSGDDYDDLDWSSIVNSKYIPVDIFEKIEIENATAIYLPMYLFEGKFEAEYTCSLQKKDPGPDDYEDHLGIKVSKKRTQAR